MGSLHCCPASHPEWERREKEHQEQECGRWEEEQRKTEEEKKIKHLDALPANWAESQNIREFVKVIERTLKDRNIQPTDSLIAWL